MFQFEHSWVLFLLPLPLLVRFFMKPGELRWQSALKVPFFNNLVSSPQLQQKKTSTWVLLGLSVLWLLLIFSAANPTWYGSPIVLDREARNIMLAVDLSGSMDTRDMQWQGQPAQRLFVVKQVAKQFIESRDGDRLGLILFGTRAYLQTPMTFDREAVWAMLDDATVGLAGPRTAIGDAIGLAIKRLQRHSDKNRVLVLLTDGANNTGHVYPMNAAKMAKKYGIRIYTIGLGATEMAVSSLFRDAIVNPSADLDEKVLRKIASLTGGQYFRAASTMQLQQVYRELDKLEPVLTDKTTFRPRTSYFSELLGMALLLGFLLLTPLLLPKVR